MNPNSITNILFFSVITLLHCSCVAFLTQNLKHVPYRSSVLTHLLKDSLGGNSRTTMIATISPNPDDYSTSMSTLRYADRAKSIRTHAVVNQTQQEKMVDGLKLEIDRLKMQLLQKEGREDELEDQIQNLNSMQDDYNGNEGMQRKRRQTVVASQMRQQRLVGMGIAISVDDVKRLQKDTPHLVNVSADPLLSEALLYPCREGTTRIGATTENSTSEEEKGGVLHQDILLAGLRIRDEHAVLINHDHDVELRALDGAQVMVNGKEVNSENGPIQLHHGDWIVFGHNHVFRFKDPTRTGQNGGAVQEEARELTYGDVVEGSSLCGLGGHSSSTMPRRASYEIIRDKDRAQVLLNVKKGWNLSAEANAMNDDLSIHILFSVTLETDVSGGDVQGMRAAVSNDNEQHSLRGLVASGGETIVKIKAVYVNEMNENEEKKKDNNDENATSLIMFEANISNFEIAMYNLRELHDQELSSSSLMHSTNNTRSDTADFNDQNMAGPMEVSGNTLPSPGSNENSNSGKNNRRKRARSTVVHHFNELMGNDGREKDRVLYQYLQCFRDAGIDSIYLHGELKESMDRHMKRMNGTNGTNDANGNGANGRDTNESKRINQNDDINNERLLDPEDLDSNGVTNTQYLMTLIKENAKLAHLLKTSQEKEEGHQHWPATFAGKIKKRTM